MATQTASVIELEEFLGVGIPKDKIPEDPDEVIFFDENKIKTLMPEGDRQRFIKRAVLDRKNERIFSMFEVRFEHCEDHFPEFPMLPMAKLGQVMAQVGSLLIMASEDFSLIADNNGKNSFPLVKSVQSIESFSVNINGKRKIFIVPNDRLLMVAEYPRGKITIKSTNISVYTTTHLIAAMSLTYEILNWPFFTRLYERQMA